MKYYPKIVVFSTLATLSHFLFTHASASLEWLVWDTSTSFAGLSVLAAWYIFYLIPYYKVGLKLFAGIYAILCCVSPVSWVINGNHHSLAIQLSILALTGLYWLIKAEKWSLLNIHQGEVTNNPCIVFTRPRNFLGWIGSLFGWGVGSSYIVVGGYRYAMSSKTLRVWKSKFTHLHNDEFIFEITTLTPAGIDYFKKECDMLVDSELNIISNNCLTCFTPVLRKFGERPKTILPGVYFKTFLKRK